MKILYFGTVCAAERYEALLNGCKSRPTVAPMVFETALLNGFSQNGAEVQILSYPMIPTVPGSRAVMFGGHTETVCGYACRWLRTVNLPFVKQWSRRLDARRAIKAWAKENAGDGVMLSYSVPPFLVKDIQHYGQRYGVKTVAIIPDLLHNMYINHKGNRVVDAFKQAYLNKALHLQGRYDGYVYLTEAMREVVAPEKPYIVMEGILNMADAAPRSGARSAPRAIMYAGRLHEKYGVMNLVEAFEQLSDLDAELWLFGEGTAVADIEARAARDARIRYFGRVSREEILRYEREASLLVNPRSVKDEFTKYSFASKTIEYMASGTPLLTAKLGGIPPEYFDYVLAVEDNEPTMLAKAMREALSLSEDELNRKGERARSFVTEHKNAAAQSGRVLNFLSKLIG